MKLTESQQAAVAQRGTNLLVAASAGSGKTEVLARRCVALIADASRPCDIDRLLVVTFTRAAAAELRARVGKMLRARRDETRDARLRDHLRRQEVLVDAAEIGTIDAWCARIVREHFAATRGGVDPAFSVLGAEEAALLRRAAVDELFEWVYAAEDELAVAAREWILRNARPSDEFLRGLVLALNSYREHLINPEQWFAAQREFYGRDEGLIRADAQRLLAEVLAAECAFQREQLEGVISAVESEIVRGQLAEYGAALETWARGLDGGSDVAETAGAIAAFRFPRKPRDIGPADAALREEVKERWFDRRLKKRWSAEWIAEVRAHAGGSARLIVTLLELEERYHRLLGDRKRSRGAYEFGDVLRMSLDLLGTSGAGQAREPTSIARTLQRRYEHILIDEYQDTSPVQVALLRLVSRCEAGRSNRFMVGDIKQSIYGFREAEPGLFGDLVDAFASGREDGRVLPLSDNFRSHADLVDGLNRLFARLFDPALGGTGYGDEERLRAQRDDVANPTLDADPRIELQLVFEAPRGGGPSDDAEDEGETVPLERIEREARIVADRIHALLEARAQIPERGADGTVALRPLRLADIVVLLRSAKGNAPLLAGVLRAAGIPCVAAGRESVFDSLEVLDVRNALALVVNRKQDVPLASFLRGPMVGLSAAELFEVRGAAPKSGLHEAVEAYREAGADRALAARLDGALTQIDAWARAARIQELPMLLRQILRDSGQVFFARALPGGEHRVAMVRALEALAADFAASDGGGVAEFVRHLEALVEQDVEPVATAAAGEDVVRIMTIHAAKGLEFPVVFLLGAGTAFSRRPQRGSLCCDERRGIGLEFFDYPARVELISAPYAVNRMARSQRELEEELRLLYVAATRARERLVIVGHTGEDTWERLRERYAHTGGTPPLISRLAAASMLEWVMMGVAAGQLASAVSNEKAAVRVETHAGEPPAPAKAHDGDGGAAADEGELSPADRLWVERGRAWIESVPDTSLAQQPAVLSVSAVKRQVPGDEGEDVPRDLEFPSPLREPAFARAAGGADGRVIGNAYHRFMQLADLRRLSRAGDVRTQIDELIARQRLTEAEAELLAADDVVWFAGTDAGQMLARRPEACRREVPFVYALPIAGGAERAVLRGVIDCLVETNDGLVILDYKTDRPRDEADRAQRVAGYTVQLQLYALAAKDVFERDVTSALLVFLRERRLEPVAVAPLSAARLFASLGE